MTELIDLRFPGIPDGFPQEFEAVIRKYHLEARYPKEESLIESEIRSFYGYSSQEILLSHGADHAIDLLARAFNFPILALNPTYSGYLRAAIRNDRKLFLFNNLGELESFAKKSNSLFSIFLCNPDPCFGNILCESDY